MEPPEIPVQPRNRHHCSNPKPQKGKKSSNDNKDNGSSRDPYGARNEDQWHEEDKPKNRNSQCHASKQKQNATGDDKGHEPNELG